MSVLYWCSTQAVVQSNPWVIIHNTEENTGGYNFCPPKSLPLIFSINAKNKNKIEHNKKNMEYFYFICNYLQELFCVYSKLTAMLLGCCGWFPGHCFGFSKVIMLAIM